MKGLTDFNCTYDNSAGINIEVTRNLGFKFPEAHFSCDSMVALSKAFKAYDETVFCTLPFCHTVEAEAMGASIRYGDEKSGPRAGEYICVSLEEVLQLPEIDFTKGRIHQVLLACEKLAGQGEKVVLELSGPFTILNALIDPKYVFRGMRKSPELVKAVFGKIEKELLRYVEKAVACGVSFISYADSAGGVNILGPKMAEQVANLFTQGFLREAEQRINENTMILLCPKTTLVLVGLDKAKFENIELEQPMLYGEACVEMLGQVKFAGQMCIKNTKYRLENKIFKKVDIL